MTLNVFELGRERPDTLAAISDQATLTYGELAARCERVRRSFSSRGFLEPGRTLALVARRSLKSLESLLVCMAEGVPVVCFGERVPASERAELAARAGALFVVTPDAEAHEHVRAEPSGHGVEQTRADVPSLDDLDPRRPLAIVPTSGTTGRSKLVVLSRAAFTASARASAANLPLSERDRWLLCLPLSHVGGLSIVTRSLLAGSAIALFEPAPGGLLADLGGLARALERSQATLVSLVPTLLDALLERDDFRPPESLRAVLLGGAGASPELIARAAARGLRVLTTYGLTEACSQVTTTPFGTIPPTRGGIVSAGRALSGVELRIGGDERIQVRGPTLATSLLDEPLPLTADGWLVTDDLGRLDEQGELYVQGRASDRIVTGGENVDPLPVEACLARDPSVAAACVFGVPDTRFGELVACALVLGPGFDAERVQSRLARELAPAARPRRVAVLAELPLTASGKLHRARTRALATPALTSWADLPLRAEETPI